MNVPELDDVEVEVEVEVEEEGMGRVKSGGGEVVGGISFSSSFPFSFNLSLMGSSYSIQSRRRRVMYLRCEM